jgi:hypothetical protein
MMENPVHSEDKLQWPWNLREALIAAFSTAFLASALSITMPNNYLSEAHILPVETKAPSLGQLSAAAATFGLSLPGQDGGDSAYMDVLNSRWMKEKLVTTQYEFRAKSWLFGGAKVRKETLLTYYRSRNLDIAVKRFGVLYKTARDPKTRLISISADTNSPGLSQQIVNRALALLEEYVQDRGRTRGGYKAAFAEARLTDAQKELNGAEAELGRFLEQNRNYPGTTDPGVRLRGMRLETDLKLKQQMIITLTLNRENALLEEKNDMPILNVLDDGNLPLEKSGPHRSVFALLGFFLGGGGALLWRNRRWIAARIRASSALAMEP